MIFPSNIDQYDRFGSEGEVEYSYSGGMLILDGNTLVVGVPNEDSNLRYITNGSTSSANNSSADSGAVFVYLRE